MVPTWPWADNVSCVDRAPGFTIAVVRCVVVGRQHRRWPRHNALSEFSMVAARVRRPIGILYGCCAMRHPIGMLYGCCDGRDPPAIIRERTPSNTMSTAAFSNGPTPPAERPKSVTCCIRRPTFWRRPDKESGEGVGR